MVIENRFKIVKFLFVVFVLLSKMLKLGKVIVLGVDIVIFLLEEFFLIEMRWFEFF